MEDLLRRVRDLEEEVRVLTRDFQDLEHDVNGDHKRSIRMRLHHVENDASAAVVAKATLEEHQRQRAAAEGLSLKRAGIYLAAIVAAGQILGAIAERAF